MRGKRAALVGFEQAARLRRPLAVLLDGPADPGGALDLRRIVGDEIGETVDAAVEFGPEGGFVDRRGVVLEHGVAHAYRLLEHRLEHRVGLAQHPLAVRGPIARDLAIPVRVVDQAQQADLEQARNGDQEQALCK